MKKSKVHVLIILTIMTTMFSTFFVYSKYSSNVTINSLGEIAVPIITNKDDEILVEVKPGDTVEYVFGVSNKVENFMSEVTMKYYIQLISLSNLPLDFELYTYDNDVLGDKNLLNDNKITDKVDVKIQDSEMVNKYKLFIKWDENEKNYLYSKETEYIKIETIAEQID